MSETTMYIRNGTYVERRLPLSQYMRDRIRREATHLGAQAYRNRQVYAVHGIDPANGHYSWALVKDCYGDDDRIAPLWRKTFRNAYRNAAVTQDSDPA